MNQLPPQDSKLDPQLREKLLKETQNPFYGPRRILWITLFSAAFLGLLIMFSRVVGGEVVPINDLGVQLGAFLFFGFLLWFDRKKK